MIRAGMGKRPRLLLSLAGLGAVICCAAASCQELSESPMTFSPSGKDLALTTLEPLHTDAKDFIAGQQVFRVMVVSQQKQVRVLEERSDALLSSPAYSPDGERLCYLRIPLLTQEQEKAQSEAVERRVKTLEDATDKPWAEWWAGGGHPKAAETQAAESQPAAGTATQAASSRPAIQMVDASLPPITGAFSPLVNSVFLPGTTAQVVVRDVRTGRVLSGTSVELPLPDQKTIYMETKPEFDPSGQWVYFSIGQVAMAVNPASGEKRVVAGNCKQAKLSPDGKTLAAYRPVDAEQSILGLIATDGQMALYRKLPFAIEYLAWVDNNTLAMPVVTREPGATSQAASSAATQPNQPESLVIQRVRRDGKLLESVKVALPKETPDGGVRASELAISPDGRHLVLGKMLLTMDGKVAGTVQGVSEEILSQPAFSPDSRTVAFKVEREVGEKTLRTEEVVFYSNAGKMLGKVAIPETKSAATQQSSEKMK